MKYLFIALFVTALTGNMNGQSWRKIYQSSLSGGAGRIIDWGDSTVFIFNVFDRFDYYGNILAIKGYNDPPGVLTYLEDFNKINTNELLISGGYADSCEGFLRGHVMLGICDTTYTSFKRREYNLNVNCSWSFNKSEILLNKSFLVYGRGTKYQSSNYWLPRGPYAMVVDSTLDNIRFAKYFPLRGSADFAKQLPDGSFILGHNLDTLGLGACLVKLDSAGNILWSKSYVRPYGAFYDAVVDSMGNIICTGYSDIRWNGNYPPCDLIAAKIDSAGNIIWSKIYQGPPYNPNYPNWVISNKVMITKTLDGNFAIGATKSTNLIYNPNVGGHAFLMKINGNGDTVNIRGYGAKWRVTELSSFIQALDSTYILAGTFEGAAPWSFGGSWLYKTDKDGYTCKGNVIDPVTINPFLITDSNYVITSVDGVTVNVIPNVTDTSVIFQGLQADDCIVTGMEQQPAIAKHYPYPNPNSGKFTMQSNQNAKIPDHLTVYDSKGIIILQKQIKSSKDLQLDLSKFGKGIYLVKIREGDKESSSKVVVE